MDKTVIALYKSFQSGDSARIDAIMKEFVVTAFNDYVNNWDTKHIRALVECGLDINQLSYKSYEMTPLMAAVRDCDLDLITWLVEQGADVNLQSSTGTTALLHLNISSINKYVERHPAVKPIDRITAILKVLLDHGLDLSLTDKAGKSVKACFLEWQTTPGVEEFLNDYHENSKLSAVIDEDDNDAEHLTF